ncbi:hypothetical protein C8R44DRAFT_874952 [Mycena epipterygia]|nr:hypothetical protein C8R44DRAFT_874952 [Mycena epipterygia]
MVVPKLVDVENTAQRHRSSTKQTYSSDSEDDIPIAVSANTSPTGIKLLVPRPSRATPVPRFLNQTNETAGPSAPGPRADVPNSPSSPPPTPPRGRPRSRSIKMLEVISNTSSKLSTKSRLAKQTVAPGLPRASPVPVLLPSQPPAAATEEVPTADDAIDIDSGPTLVPDATSNTADVVTEGTTMLASMCMDESMGEGEGEGEGNSIYRPGEDRYAGLRNKPLNDAIDYEFNVEDEDGPSFDFDEVLAPVPDVDAFLSTVLSTVPHLPPLPMKKPDYRPTQPVRKPAPIPQWSWNGQVTISVDGRPQNVCESATLTDCTPAAVSNKPRMGSFVHPGEDLHFTAFYDIEDLRMILPAYMPPQQFARLSAEGSASFNVFVEFISRKEQVMVLPALFDGDTIGCLIFLPPSAKSMLGYLGHPRDLCQPGSLIAALLFRTPPVEQYRRAKFSVEFARLERTEPVLLPRDQWRKSLQIEPAYQLALRIIRPPKHIQKFAYTHASVVWFQRTPDDVFPDKDTEHLRAILKKSKVGIVSPNDPSAEIVFVHVAAMRNIHNLPLLGQRRLRPEVRFCLYGTHESIPIDRWGFREIYLLGGIVTFTPEALLGDTWGVLNIIRHIDAHPLWACYVIPQVVGMAMRLNECREDDSLQEYRDVLPLALDRIFEAIQNGQVALMRAPFHNPTSGEKKIWVDQHIVFRPMSKEAVLNCCTQAFDEAYGSFPQPRWSTLAKNDVIADMRRLQAQPAFFDEYRRFVVLNGSAAPSQYNGGDGIEWHSVGRFEFQDDFLKEL